LSDSIATKLFSEVNEHPIASKAMLKHWICDAVKRGEMVQLSIERLVCGDDTLRDQIETPTDVQEIAQKQVDLSNEFLTMLQIHEIKSNSIKSAVPVMTKARARRSKSPLRVVEKPIEVNIQADHDATKLKPCKQAKN
jgi:hypothetical protein